MKRTRSLQKFAAQFGYEHKNRSNPFSSIKKHANELSKLLDSMFPKDKNDKEKSSYYFCNCTNVCSSRLS